MKALLALCFLCAACGGDLGDRVFVRDHTEDHGAAIEEFTPAEAAAVGRGCEDTNGDGFCDVEITLTVTWPEEWR